MIPPFYRLDMTCPICVYETSLVSNTYPHNPPRVRCAACLQDRHEVIELVMVSAEQIDCDPEEKRSRPT